MIQQRLEHGRHARQGCRLYPLHGGQHLRRVEAGQHHHLAAIYHRAIERAGIGEDVEKGQDRDDAIRLMLARIDRLRLARIGGQILVRQHCTLGRAGRTAGVLQQRDVVDRVDLRHRAIALVGHEPVIADDPRIIGDGQALARLEPSE